MPFNIKYQGGGSSTTNQTTKSPTPYEEFVRLQEILSRIPGLQKKIVGNEIIYSAPTTSDKTSSFVLPKIMMDNKIQHQKHRHIISGWEGNIVGAPNSINYAVTIVPKPTEVKKSKDKTSTPKVVNKKVIVEEKPQQLKMVSNTMSIEPFSFGTPSITRQPIIQPDQSGDYVLRFSELNSEGQNQPRELFFKTRKEADDMMNFLQKENNRRYETGTYYSNLTTQGNYRKGGIYKGGGQYSSTITTTTLFPTTLSQYDKDLLAQWSNKSKPISNPKGKDRGIYWDAEEGSWKYRNFWTGDEYSYITTPTMQGSTRPQGWTEDVIVRSTKPKSQPQEPNIDDYYILDNNGNIIGFDQEGWAKVNNRSIINIDADQLYTQASAQDINASKNDNTINSLTSPAIVEQKRQEQLAYQEQKQLEEQETERRKYLASIPQWAWETSEETRARANRAADNRRLVGDNTFIVNQQPFFNPITGKLERRPYDDTRRWYYPDLEEKPREMSWGEIGLMALPFAIGAAVTSPYWAPAVGTALAAPLTIGSTVYPSITAGNLLAAYGLTNSAINATSNIAKGNYLDAATNIGWGALDAYALNPSIYRGIPNLLRNFSRAKSATSIPINSSINTTFPNTGITWTSNSSGVPAVRFTTPTSTVTPRFTTQISNTSGYGIPTYARSITNLPVNNSLVNNSLLNNSLSSKSSSLFSFLRPRGFETPVQTGTREATVQLYNPSTQMYETRLVTIPEQVIPGRSYSDIAHKMKNLRKDLNISLPEHYMNRLFGRSPIPLERDRGLIINPEGRIWDSNTRYWLNRQYGNTPDPLELIESNLSQYARSFGKVIGESKEPTMEVGKLIFNNNIPKTSLWNSTSTPNYNYSSMFGFINPVNLNTQGGLAWMRNWYKDPDFIRRMTDAKDIGAKIRYAGNSDYPKELQSKILESLDYYKPKNYFNLLKDEGLKEYIKSSFNSSGVSWGTPSRIYVNNTAFFPFNLKGKEATRAHELTHLIEANGRRFTSVDIQRLLKPFGYKTFSEVPADPKDFKSIITDNRPQYYLDPSEIHARMNEARFNLGLTPKDKFTSEMYDKLKKQGFYGMGRYIKDKQGFIDLMNNFWSITTPIVGGGLLINSLNKNSQNKQ